VAAPFLLVMTTLLDGGGWAKRRARPILARRKVCDLASSGRVRASLTAMIDFGDPVPQHADFTRFSRKPA